MTQWARFLNIGQRKKEMYILTETGGQTVTTALFIIAPNWSQPHCPSTGERINRQSLHPTDPLSFVVQLLSCVRLFAPPWTAACQASQSFTIGQSLLKLMSIELMMPTNHRILHHPLLLLPSIFPIIRVFSKESVLSIRWPKCWCLNFSNSPSNEYSGLISFRMDWLDILAVQGTLKSLLQHHIAEASILLGSAFFIVQLSHPYMTTGKTIALTGQTFLGKVMSLLFNMLSRFVIAFLLREASCAILLHTD